MIIDYSKEFKEFALQLFPKWKQLQEAIDNNEADSVRIAIGNINTIITPKEVVESFDYGKLAALYMKAKHQCDVIELENMWYREYDRSDEEITQKNEIGVLERELFD